MAKGSDSERAEVRRGALKRFMVLHDIKSVNAWAKEAKVSESGVRGFINGDTDSMNLLTYEKLAEAKGATLSDILGLDLPPAVTRGPSATHKIAKRNNGLPPVHENVKSPAGSERAESHSLAGIEQVSGQAEGARALRPRVNDSLAETVMVPELDVKAAAGGGSADPAEIGTDAPVIAQWHLPVHFIRQFRPGPAPGLAVITAIGHSMEPTIRANTQVLVDIRDRKPSPPGIFVVWDGFALVIKNVQPIPFSDPPRVKISSENPSFDPYERVEEEAYIQGRVVGHWRAT